MVNECSNYPSRCNSYKRLSEDYTMDLKKLDILTRALKEIKEKYFCVNDFICSGCDEEEKEDCIFQIACKALRGIGVVESRKGN